MPLSFAGLVLAGLLAQAPAPAEPVLAEAEARAARGDLAGAADAYRRILADARGSRAIVLYRLADLERRTGDHSAAAAHAIEAADVFVAAGDPATASEALNVAGMAETNLGRFDVAIVRFERAMALSREAGDWARHAEQWTNLGTVLFPLGRYDEAAAAFAGARTLADDHASAPWAAHRRAIVLANEAALLQRLGRYTDALDRYRAMVSAGPPLAPGQQGQVLVNQGALFRRLGDPYKALDAYAAARTSLAAAGDGAAEAAVLTNRGIVLALDLARPAEAVTAFSEALAVATAAGVRREALLAQLYRGEARLRNGDIDLAEEDFGAALALASALEIQEEAWKALFGLGRAARARHDEAGARAALDRAIAIVDGLRERLAVPSSRAEFFQDKRQVYDERIAAGLGADPPGVTFALIEQSRARAWRDRMAVGPVGLDAVQSTLPSDTVLLAYWTADTRAAVVRVTRDNARVVPLALDADAVRTFDDAVRNPARQWTAAAAALGAALVPTELVDGARRLIVVPDGALGAIPFDALLIDGAPLGARLAVSVLPTAALRQAAVPLPHRGWRAPWTRQLTAFGDPLAGTDALAGLPSSAAEVRAVAAALGGTHRLFLGADNTKRALLDAVAAPTPVLHLASHAVADLTAGEQSRLMFSPGTVGGPTESLYLREVYALPLSGVDLAVLSACETERGPDVRGEGVQGFSRALLAAGARRAITTLWRVPDGPTAALMQRFYEGVQAGRPLDDALAEAKRAVRDTVGLGHPHYWAAFVLTGPTDALPRTLRWRELAGVALVVAGTIAALVARRGRHRSARAATGPVTGP